MRNLYPEYISLVESLHQNTQMFMMNVFLEEYMRVNGGDTEFKFPTVSIESSLERECEYLEALDLTISKTNKEILDKFSEGAISKNPIGLSLDYVSECDISAKYEEDAKVLMGSLKATLESGDTAQLSSITTCISGKGHDVTTVLRNTVCCGKKMDGCLDMILNKEYGKPITKECVKEAVAFLEKGCSEKIKEIKKVANEKCKSYKEKACNMKNDMDKAAKVVHGQCKKEGCNKESCKKEGCKNAKECSNEAVASCFAVNTYLMEQDFLDHAYIVTLENQLLEMVTQARKIVMCAYDYDPRDYANSLATVQEMAEQIEERCNEAYTACLEMDMKEYLIEAGFKEKLQELKSKMVLSNQKFLKKYQDRALKSECSGLVIDKWYEFPDIDKKYEDTLSKLKKLFKGKDFDSMSDDELKDFYKSVKTGMLNTGSAANIARDFLRSDEGGLDLLYKKAVVKLVRNHKITKQDVKNAVDTLKNITTDIDSAYRALNDKVISLAYANPRNRGIGVGLTKAERYKKNINKVKDTVMRMLEKDYSGAIYHQLVAKQQQARKVILMAARESKTENAMFDDELISLIEEAYSYITLE